MPAMWDLADDSATAWDAFQNLYECGKVDSKTEEELPRRMTSSELLG